MLTKERVLELGFKELPHKNLLNSLVLDIGRRRQLSISSLGSPNEMLSIYEINMSDDKQIDDLIILHNFDYNGYLTEEKLSLLLTFFAKNK